MSNSKIKSKLIDLFLSVKINELTDNEIDQEREKLSKVSCEDLINYIYNSIDILVDIKAQEKYDEKMKEKAQDNILTEEEGMNIYESLLIKAEKDTEQELKLRIEELELQIDEIERGKSALSLNLKNQCLTKNLTRSINISNNNSNNNFQIIKNLQSENERLKKLLVSYQIKYEKYSNEERKLKFKVQQQEKENKYLNNKISKLVINTNKQPDNKDLQITSTIQNGKKEVKAHSSISSCPTPKKKEQITINKNYLTNSTKKIKQQSKMSFQPRTSSRMRKRTDHNNSKNNTTITEKRNESCLVVNRRYQNFLEQFEANTLRIVNMEKKKQYKTTSMEAKKANKIKKYTNTNASSNSKQSFHNKFNPKQNVIINNYNNVNYINVYTTGYGSGELKKRCKTKKSENK